MTDEKRRPRSLEEAEEFRRWIREHDKAKDEDKEPTVLEMASELNRIDPATRKRRVIQLTEEE